MSVSTDLVEISLSGGSRTPRAQGFGVTACVSYHTKNTDVFREYTDISGAESDGFTSKDAGHKMLSAIFDQSPRPVKAALVRGPIPTVTWAVVVTSAVEGEVVKLTVVSPDGTVTDISYTILAAATTTTVATALELLIEACSGISSTSSVATVTVTPTTAGQMFWLRAPQNCTISENTGDPGYAATLAAYKATATADFFFFDTECHGAACVSAARAWGQTNKRMYMPSTSNTAEKSGSSVIGAAIVASLAEFCTPFFSSDASEYMGCAAAGFAGARNPGSYTLAAKGLVSVTPSSLTDTEMTNLKTAGLTFQTTMATGLSGIMGQYGGSLTGDGNSFLDKIHGREWWIARTAEAVVTALASNDKVDYDNTAQGTDLIKSQVEGVNAQAVRQRLFRGGEDAPVVTISDVDDMTTADKLVRYFPGVQNAATYLGAIHKVKITAVFTD